MSAVHKFITHPAVLAVAAFTAPPLVLAYLPGSGWGLN